MPLFLDLAVTRLFLLTGFISLAVVSAKTDTPCFPSTQWKSSSTDGTEGWDEMKIRYQKPALPGSHYGIPLGNGFFGVEQCGAPGEEVFQLNHKGFWSGDPQYMEELRQGKGGFGQTPEQRKAAFDKTRKLLTEAYSQGRTPESRLAKMKEAEEASTGMWCASYQATYLPMGNLHVCLPAHKEGYSDYERVLDMDGAASLVSYVHEGVTYTREAFVSYPDKVMAVKFTNDEERPMEMEIFFDPASEMSGKSPDNKVFADKDRNEVVMTGRAPVIKTGDGGQWHSDRGVTFEARVKAIPTGGRISCSNQKLILSGATEIILLYSCETSYKDCQTDPAKSGVDVAGNVRQTLDNASVKTYPALRDRHQADFRSLFRRFWLHLDGSPVQAGNHSIKPEEYVRYYQYGRYIMISGEREKTQDLPLNLCGLWNPNWNPPNESAYFLNENLQKMHALSGPGNLSDTSEPYWKWIKNVAHKERGGKTALESFGIRDAWTVSHSSDAWAKTELWGDSTHWANWSGGGLWIAHDLFNAYDFTGDTDFLANSYPVFEGAARFLLGSLMTVDGNQGELKQYQVMAPSSSPEHWFLDEQKNYVAAVDIMTTGDLWACRNLFHILLKSAGILKHKGRVIDESLVTRVRTALEKLPPVEMYIDKKTNRLKEWYNEYKSGEEGHRHASHLMGFFFGYAGMPCDPTSKLFQASRNELERLGNLGGGYHPDIVTMGIRAGLPSWGLGKILETSPDPWANGQFIWKWFPISAPIAEALLDSRYEELHILPFLPEEWKSGTVSGIRARGGAQLKITWENGELKECFMDVPSSQVPVIKYKGEKISVIQDKRFVIKYHDECGFFKKE